MRCAVIIFMLVSMVGCSCSHYQKTSQSNSGAIDTVYNTVHDTIYDTLIIKDTIYQDMTIWSTECVFPNDMRSDLNDALQGDEWGFFDYNHSCYNREVSFISIGLCMFITNHFRGRKVCEFSCLNAFSSLGDAYSKIRDPYSFIKYNEQPIDDASKMLALYFLTLGVKNNEGASIRKIQNFRSHYYKEDRFDPENYHPYDSEMESYYWENECKDVILAFKDN